MRLTCALKFRTRANMVQFYKYSLLKRQIHDRHVHTGKCLCTCTTEHATENSIVLPADSAVATQLSKFGGYLPFLSFFTASCTKRAIYVAIQFFASHLQNIAPFITPHFPDSHAPAGKLAFLRFLALGSNKVGGWWPSI